MAEDFALEISRFIAGTTSQLGQIQQAVKAEVYKSVVHGSTLTGSAGLPVDTKLLRDSYSWKEVSRGKSQLSSNVAYAGVIEYGDRGFWDPNGVWEKGTRPHTYEKSGEPYRGSIRKTIEGWSAIVAYYGKSKQRLTGLGEADGRNG
jgi:hypothetical protein